MIEVSWSRVRSWRRCHKQHDYKYNQRLQRKRPKPPMLTGTILHEMLDARATGGNPKAILEKYAKQYRALFLEEREMYGDIIQNIDRVFAGYVRQYGADSMRTIASEQFIATNITKRIRFVGYIDKILEDASKRLWLGDHKTGRNIPGEDARFSDLQLVFYTWAWNRERPTQRIGGVLWDYLRTKPPAIPELLKNGQLTQRANIDTDYFTYAQAIKDNKLDVKDYAETLARLQDQVSPFFKRVFLPNPPQALVDQVVDDLTVTAREIEHLGEISHTRTMQKDCSSCIYFQLCHAELRGQDADYIRKAEFEIKEASDGEEETAEDTE